MGESAFQLVRRGVVGLATPPELDEHQRAVVEHAKGPLLVLAGPGTGKTTTIVESVAHRIERGTDPERVLVLTFSRKAAGELRERISSRLGKTTRNPLALTFHSYAYALLRREAVRNDEPAPRLLSGPEQLLEVRRILHGEIEDGARSWPARLRPALATRGFAEELRDFLLRAAERGLDGRDLKHLGRLHGRDDWTAAGRFADRYAARFDLDPVPALDYTELIREAAGLLSDADVRLRERSAYDIVYVDEYQDTDPAQEYLLQQLAGGGRDLVVVGDPDQSIYGFRGADVSGILNFPDRFRTLDGAEAPVIALRVGRRSGPELLTASRRVAARLPHPPSRAGHRDLEPLPDADPGDVHVIVAESASQEAAVVADTLRRARLLEGVPWSRMAVLVRSAQRSVPVLRRALLSAGVPVIVAGDEVPLTQEPGVRPLMTLLRAAIRPRTLDEATAEELLTGPLGGTDALGLRRLRRELKHVEAVAAAQSDGLPFEARTSGELLVAALKDKREMILLDDETKRPAERVADLIAVAREIAQKGGGPSERGAGKHGGSAEDVLWGIWQQSGLAERWTQLSIAGGSKGAQADRDLDAVVALFDHAARFVDRLPGAGPEVFLDDLTSQEIPGDTLAEQAPEGDAVRILTAHRSKGLEWDVVVVAGVQEGLWPDLRLRGSLLGTEELVERQSGVEDVQVAALTSKMLAEERRLFYVAATRARRTLVVTAVGGEDGEERPSRFLTELLPGAAEGAGLDERTRWLSLPALVADLRSAVSDASRPDPVRRAAAAHLARLARAGIRGAHPSQWYGLAPISDARPLTWPDDQVKVSPSKVESFAKCGLRWLLEVAVGARGSGLGSQVGLVVHAIAELAAADPSEAQLVRRMDEVWESLEFEGKWFARKERDRAELMVQRLLDWHRSNPRDLVEVEKGFAVSLPGPDGTIRITGKVDRLERDDSGRAVIVDIKTGSSAPTAKELDRHPQLGVYQLAAALGAFERHGLIEPGGAELVQVGKAAGARLKVQAQPVLDGDWARDLVETVAAGMSGPVFEAKVNDGCRSCPVKSSCPAQDTLT